jgi:hypothetical protein
MRKGENERGIKEGGGMEEEEKFRRKEEEDIPEEKDQILSNSPIYIHPPSPPYLGRNDQ